MNRLIQQFFVIALILFSTAIFAQRETNQSLNKNDLKNYILEMIKRNITVQNMIALQKSGYSDQDIQEIIQSDRFKKFVTNVVQTPAIEKVLDQKVAELLSPGYLEAKIQKRISEADAERRESLLLALQELSQYKNRPSKNLQAEPETFFNKLWKQVKKDLFG